MQSCPICGNELPDSAIFCAKCGHLPGATNKLDRVKKIRQSPSAEVGVSDNTATLKMRRMKGARSRSSSKIGPLEGEVTLKVGRAKIIKRLSQIEGEVTQKVGRARNIKLPPVEDETTIKVERVRRVKALPPEEDEVTRKIERVSRVKSLPPEEDETTIKVERVRRVKVLPQVEVEVAGGSSANVAEHNEPSRVPLFIRRLFTEILNRAGDPKPESRPVDTGVADVRIGTLGWLPFLTLVSALGLFVVVVAYNIARNSGAEADLYFWAGILLMFGPALVRLILPGPSRLERIGLLCVVGVCLYLVKVTLSPLYLTGYDEMLHWRTASDIASSGHLFSKNTLLPVSPLFPGLEIVTNALSSLSGLDTIQSGNVVVGVARLVMILALYLLNEQITGSERIASIATIFYMANPHFLFFDAQFAYESLGLPLATFVIFALVRYETLSAAADRRWVVLAAWIVLGALIVTHHLTNFIFEGIFILWTITYAFLRPFPIRRSVMMWTAVLGLVMTIASIALIGMVLVQYFGSFFKDIWIEISQVLMSNSGGISGGSGGGGRQLFANYSDQPTPLWERATTLFSVVIITFCLPLSWFCLWRRRRYRKNALMWVFAIMTLFYPISLLLRLTDTGAEASDRASAFLFLAISSLLAILIAQFWPVRWLNWKQTGLLSVVILLIFIGGIVLGSGIPQTFLPGRYQVSADARSIEPEGIEAAIWTHEYLGPNNRMATDRINQLLMSTYGGQYLVTPIGDHVDISDVFFSQVVGTYEKSLLKQGRVRYLVVDLRLSTAPPVVGVYFEQGESGTSYPMNREFLTKFDTMPRLNRLFDSGNIVIYDVGGLINAPQEP